MGLTSKNAVILFPAFSASAENPFTGSLKEETGATVLWQLTGTFFLCSSGTYDGIVYKNFCNELALKLGAVSPNTYTYSCLFKPSTMELYLQNSEEFGFTMSLATAQTRGVMGHDRNPGTTIQAVYYTSSCAPWYSWRSSHPERSDWTRPYEPAPFYIDHEAENGAAYSVGRSASPIYSDWSFKLEPNTRVWTAFSASTEPYTLQRVIEGMRSVIPFQVLTPSAPGIIWGIHWEELSDYMEGTYRLRGENTGFKPKFQKSNWHGRMDVDFKTRVFSGSHRGGY